MTTTSPNHNGSNNGMSSLCTMHIRTALKIIRNPAMTAYDYLPNGETLGEFANRTAVEGYIRNVENKRLRTRESRKKRKKKRKACKMMSRSCSMSHSHSQHHQKKKKRRKC